MCDVTVQLGNPKNYTETQALWLHPTRADSRGGTLSRTPPLERQEDEICKIDQE